MISNFSCYHLCFLILFLLLVQGGEDLHGQIYNSDTYELENRFEGKKLEIGDY